MSRVVAIAPEPVLPTPRSRITPAVRYRVMDSQKGLCAACGEPLAPGFHIDHVKPLWAEGVDDESNYAAMCPPCHIAKSAVETESRAKAKRIAFKHAGLKKPGAGQIRSRGFQKWSPPDFEDAP